MASLRQLILEKGQPQILSHKFGDGDIEEVSIENGTVDLFFDPDNLGDTFLQIHRHDAIAIAKHFNVTATELNSDVETVE